MPPCTKVIFYWLDRFNRRCKHETIYTYFKTNAITLLEQEQQDIIRDIYYTIGSITKKLDYYNERL